MKLNPNYTIPLNFLKIKRATADIKSIENRFLSEHFLPEDKDLLGVVEGLLRLQFFYKMKTKDLVDGIIDGEQKRPRHYLFVIRIELRQFCSM